jgi:hypothetical protein
MNLKDEGITPRDGTFITGGSTLKFSDGMSFNTDGEYRITRRSDGLYVIGKGLLCPVNSLDEGKELIKELSK